MAKYGKNNYFDGVILPEPKEEMLRRMAKGVKMGYNQYVDKSASTMFKSPSMPIGTGDFTLEYFGNAYWATKSKTPLIFNDSTHSTYSKGSFLVYGDSELAIRWVLFEAPMSGAPTDDSILLSAGDRETPFHFVVTRKGTTVKAYFNGELKATKEQSAVKDLGDFRLGMANSSNMVMSRIYNYALSADEIATLYNNGDPMGYVVPKASRYFEKSYQSNFTDGTDGWTGYRSSSGLLIESKEGILEISGDYANYQIRMPYPPAPKCASRYKMRVEFAEPVSISRYALYAFTGNSAFQENVTEPKTILDGVTPLDNNPSRYCYIYLYGITPNTVVRIKSVTIEPAGLLAEYLPQNLIPTAEGSVVQWLDSAPQLPEANGILPPLDASVGGYDLAAIGNPKIII